MVVGCQKNVYKIKLRQFIANHIKLFNINSPDKHYVQGNVQFFPLARLINRLYHFDSDLSYMPKKIHFSKSI